MRIAVIALVALAASFPQANAKQLTQEQKNLIENLAALYLADKWCSDDYKVSMAELNRIFSISKLKADEIAPHFQATSDEIMKGFDELGAKVNCRLLYELYGPSGSGARGLMIRK